jgi:two-component system cell cycle sensor histidine kinase/response regulator CckA
VLSAHPCPYEIDHQILEYRFQHKDGSYLWLRDEKRIVRDADGMATEVVGSWSDVTQRVQLEAQLRQAQKLEAIGQLAGGVAHDFNNLLTIICGYSEIMLPQFPPTDPLREMVSQIRKAGDRAASLTRQLLAFSRQTVLEPIVVDLNDLVRENEKMLARLIGEDVELTTTLGPDLPRIKVDPGQITQIIMNLAVNARDAMPRGGKLAIETRLACLDEHFVHAHADLPPGFYDVLTIRDSGSGMDDATMARIFEPFFTTKGPGKGTGLGLAVVFGIAKQSGGHIIVKSEVGAGTEFQIFLPAIDDLPRRSSHHGEVIASSGSESVLLVEDDEGVRELAAFALQSHGFQLVKALSGRSALNIGDDTLQSVDLLVTDIVMPEMSGRELAELIRAKNPRLKVLFVSGYTDDALMRHGVRHAEVKFLQKPYTPLALIRRVREILDEQAMETANFIEADACPVI